MGLVSRGGAVRVGEALERDDLLRRLTQMQYARNNMDFRRGTFRARGDVVEVFVMVAAAVVVMMTAVEVVMMAAAAAVVVVMVAMMVMMLVVAAVVVITMIAMVVAHLQDNLFQLN